MKVRDLVTRLQQLDQDLPVYLACEDADVVAPGYFVRPFVVDEVSPVDILTSRSESGAPEMAAAAAGEGQRCAVISITSEF